MEWMIVTDSSCDLIRNSIETHGTDIEEVPFAINVGEKEFIDDKDLDVGEMVDAMEAYQGASHTSCPSPAAWYEVFEKADKIIAMTISANLSGSYNSAVAAREMILEKYPDKRIYILNSFSTGPSLAIFVEKAVDFINNGFYFDAVVEKLQNLARHTHTIFALASYENLMKNGRVNRIIGFLAGKLGIWGVGVGSDEGTIHVKKSARGEVRTIMAFLEDMKQNGFSGGEVFISHCQNLQLAERLRGKIQELWHDAKIKIMPTKGLCSFYAERRGLIVCYTAAERPGMIFTNN